MALCRVSDHRPPCNSSKFFGLLQHAFCVVLILWDSSFSRSNRSVRTQIAMKCLFCCDMDRDARVACATLHPHGRRLKLPVTALAVRRLQSHFDVPLGALQIEAGMHEPPTNLTTLPASAARQRALTLVSEDIANRADEYSPIPLHRAEWAGLSGNAMAYVVGNGWPVASGM